MSLSGGAGFQSTQLMPRSFSVCAKVSTASEFAWPCDERGGDIVFVGAIGAGYIFGVGDFVAVEPDIGAVIDAAEMQPHMAACEIFRQLEFGAIPPGAAERAVLRHGQQRKILADGIGGAGNVAQIFSEVGIGISFVGDERGYDG